GPAAIRHALEAAILDTGRAEPPVGTWLSGGLDSTLITAILARRQAVPAFTIGYPGDVPENESPFARAVAAALAVPHRETMLTDVDVVETWREAAWHLEEPGYTPVTVSTYALSRFARGSVSVALSGDGADELFL